MTTLYTPEQLHVLRAAYADGKTPTRVELLHMLNHIDTLTARLAVVRELHQERPNSTSALYPNPLCSCGKEYPCPTIQAIDPSK